MSFQEILRPCRIGLGWPAVHQRTHFKENRNFKFVCFHLWQVRTSAFHSLIMSRKGKGRGKGVKKGTRQVSRSTRAGITFLAQSKLPAASLEESLFASCLKYTWHHHLKAFEQLQYVWTWKRWQRSRQGRRQASPQSSSWQHPGYHETRDSSFGLAVVVRFSLASCTNRA